MNKIQNHKRSLQLCHWWKIAIHPRNLWNWPKNHQLKTLEKSISVMIRKRFVNVLGLMVFRRSNINKDMMLVAFVLIYYLIKCLSIPNLKEHPVSNDIGIFQPNSKLPDSTFQVSPFSKNRPPKNPTVRFQPVFGALFGCAPCWNRSKFDVDVLVSKRASGGVSKC